MQAEKKLTLLRHGEAALGMGQSGDLKRKLTPNGKSKLLRLRDLLTAEKVTFDFAAYSPATRCRETLKVIKADDKIATAEMFPSIYEASVRDLLSVINSFEDRYSDVLLVGHNPGISHLLGFLTGDSSIVFTPGLMVRMSFDLSNWGMVSRNSGSIVEVMQ